MESMIQSIYKFFGWHYWVSESRIFRDHIDRFKICKICGTELVYFIENVELLYGKRDGSVIENCKTEFVKNILQS